MLASINEGVLENDDFELLLNFGYKPETALSNVAFYTLI